MIIDVCSDKSYAVLILNLLNLFKDYKRYIYISYDISDCVQQKKS